MNIHSGLFGGVRKVFGARTGGAGDRSSEAPKLGRRKGGPLAPFTDLPGSPGSSAAWPSGQARGPWLSVACPSVPARSPAGTRVPIGAGGQDERREGQGRNEHSFRLRALGLVMRLGLAGGVCLCGRRWQASAAAAAAAAAAAVWTANTAEAVRGACILRDAGAFGLCAVVSSIDRTARQLTERGPVLVEPPQPAARMIRTGARHRKGGDDRRRKCPVPLS